MQYTWGISQYEFFIKSIRDKAIKPLAHDACTLLK